MTDADGTDADRGIAGRPIDRLLAEYGESHQNETNKAVHWVCVPVIVWTVIALLWALPDPVAVPFVNWATLLLALSSTKPADYTNPRARQENGEDADFRHSRTGVA